MKVEFNEVFPINENRNQNVSSSWFPPALDILKLNVDAAFSASSGKARYGMVVRDSTGKICLCAVSKEEDANTVLHAELKAILFGLKIACNNFTETLIVESDSLLAINKIRKQHDTLCEWGSLITDIVDKSLDYGTCYFHHICRSANVLAHNIAKLSCETEDFMIRRESVPPTICNHNIIYESYRLRKKK
ncbi:hypothetical protein CRYUN_Cryun04dG0148800 [Craigia yunnanensis]